MSNEPFTYLRKMDLMITINGVFFVDDFYLNCVMVDNWTIHRVETCEIDNKRVSVQMGYNKDGLYGKVFWVRLFEKQK